MGYTKPLVGGGRFALGGRGLFLQRAGILGAKSSPCVSLQWFHPHGAVQWGQIVHSDRLPAAPGDPLFMMFFLPIRFWISQAGPFPSHLLLSSGRDRRNGTPGSKEARAAVAAWLSRVAVFAWGRRGFPSLTSLL